MSASKATSSSRKGPPEPAGNGDSSSSTVERFILRGPSLDLDSRVHAYRKDIADIALAGELFAPHYARPSTRSCGRNIAPVRSGPSLEAEAVSELLPGEQFAMLELSGGWAWGYCRADHYVGYVEAAALVDPFRATHLISTAKAPLLTSPDSSAIPAAELPMGAQLSGEEISGFLSTDGGFIPLTHLRRVEAVEPDPAGIAERLLGAPYRAGGRSVAGIDCSGLVQLALALSGFPAPRDCDQQRSIGDPLPEGAMLQRSDLVFVDGHVGLMIDATDMIHANATTGTVAVEPLAVVSARVSDGAPAVKDRRRLRL